MPARAPGLRDPRSASGAHRIESPGRLSLLAFALSLLEGKIHHEQATLRTPKNVLLLWLAYPCAAPSNCDATPSGFLSDKMLDPFRGHVLNQTGANLTKL